MTDPLAAAHTNARLAVERAKAILSMALIDAEKAPPLLAISKTLTELAQIRTIEQVAHPTTPPAAPTPYLSRRQLQILRLVADDASTDEIAASLDLSPQTVRTHLQNTNLALAVHSRAGAVGKACRLNLL